jgi:hypothetical protein
MMLNYFSIVRTIVIHQWVGRAVRPLDHFNRFEQFLATIILAAILWGYILAITDFMRWLSGKMVGK